MAAYKFLLGMLGILLDSNGLKRICEVRPPRILTVLLL